MTTPNILILGGGICGVATAIAISKAFSDSNSSTPQPKITIFELRNIPDTIGGAVNLTPKALRCLDILGILDELKANNAGCEVSSIQLFSLHTGSSLGTIDYRGKDGNGYGGYRGWRIMRSELLEAVLSVARKMENVELIYGKKVTGVSETADSVKVNFEDGTDATGTLALGCDGIHSATRMQFIEPERVPKYSGVATAYGFTMVSEVLDAGDKLFFEDTALAMSRYGGFLMSYCDGVRQKMYVSALMETKQQISKEGWRALGGDKDAVKASVVGRFENSALPNMNKLVHGTNEWFLYPVYTLTPEGKWSTSRVMLLGDAAHAMPPKGESIGYALEDATIFSAVLLHFGLTSDMTTIFSFYESIRRTPINEAYKDAAMGWDSNKDSGWLFTKLMELFTPLYLWWTKTSRETSYAADPRDIKWPS